MNDDELRRRLRRIEEAATLAAGIAVVGGMAAFGWFLVQLFDSLMGAHVNPAIAVAVVGVAGFLLWKLWLPGFLRKLTPPE